MGLTRRRVSILLAALAMTLLGACSVSTSSVDVALNGDVVIHVPFKPAARVTAGGDLAIDGKPVPVTPVQRSALAQYDREFTAIQQAGHAIGRAGHRLSAGIDQETAHAGSAAASGAARRDVAGFSTSLTGLCDQVAALVALQDSIAATLPAFRPYAVLTQDKVRACRIGTGVASDAVRMAAGVARWGGRAAHAASAAGKAP
jgi:hypothetical protein